MRGRATAAERSPLPQHLQSNLIFLLRTNLGMSEMAGERGGYWDNS